MQGKIIKGIAGFYYVYAEDGNTYECRAKGIFRKDKRKPLVGDNVDITVLDEKELEGSVTEIHKRKNSSMVIGLKMLADGLGDAFVSINAEIP